MAGSGGVKHLNGEGVMVKDIDDFISTNADFKKKTSIFLLENL